MFERRDGSAVRVMTAPWRANFLAGFRAIPGLVSLGTFFASKESTSATPKDFKTARRAGEKSYTYIQQRGRSKRKTRLRQAYPLAAKAKII